MVCTERKGWFCKHCRRWVLWRGWTLVRTLLAQELQSERDHIEVLLHMECFKVVIRKRHEPRFALSQAEDTEIRLQGLLGLAETARNLGEKDEPKNYTDRSSMRAKTMPFPFRHSHWLHQTENSEDVLLAWNAIDQLSKTTNENHTRNLSIITFRSRKSRRGTGNLSERHTVYRKHAQLCINLWREQSPASNTTIPARIAG